MDARDLKFSNRSFDLVTLMFGTLSHFSLSDQVKVLANIMRVLKLGGHLVVSNWNTSKISAYLSIYSKRDINLLKSNGRGPRQLARILKILGYDVKCLKHFCTFSNSELRRLIHNKCSPPAFYLRCQSLNHFAAILFERETNKSNNNGQMYFLAAIKSLK